MWAALILRTAAASFSSELCCRNPAGVELAVLQSPIVQVRLSIYRRVSASARDKVDLQYRVLTFA